MQYLLLENVTRSYGEKVLFKEVNLSVSKGDKIALVAKNGSGKTTLLKVISGEEGSDGENAKITIAKDIKTSILKQDPVFDPEATVMETIFDSDNEGIIAVRDYEKALNSNDEALLQKCVTRLEDLKAWDLEAKIHEILNKLLLTDLNQKTGEMSGGQKKRLALAQILIEEPDFLILDEPTNHLDIESIIWLEEFLADYKGAVVMISHDKIFLDKITKRTIEIELGRIYDYQANYSNYLIQRVERRTMMMAAYENQQKLIAQKEKTIARFMAKATNGFVDVRDVAEFAVRMLDYQGEEEKFLMIGDNIPYKTFLEKIAQHIHKKAPHIVAKKWTLGLAWRLDRLRTLITGGRPMLTKETAITSSKTFLFDNIRSLAVGGFQYTPIDESIRDIAEQFLEASTHNFNPSFLNVHTL